MIKSIELNNWKAFDKGKIDFLDGVNFLVGRNAIGKTSVLEAICVAFTGEALTVDDPRKLVREGANEPANIIVEFLHDLKNYSIKRVISKERRLFSAVYFNGEMKTQGWDEVSNYIGDLLGIDKNFFERVVYMSEGDIFRFLSSRSDKTSIMAQIEQALAIDKMTDLRDEVKRQTEFYQNLEVEQKKQVECFSQLLPQQTLETSSLEAKHDEIKHKIDALKKEINRLEEEVYQKKQQADRLNNAIQKINETKQTLDTLVDGPSYEREFLKETQLKRESLEKKLNDTEQKIEPKIKEKGAIEERILAIKKILDLLFLIEKETESVIACPVCGKALYANEVKNLKDKFTVEKQAAQSNLNFVIREIEDLETIRNRYNADLQKLRSCETTLGVIYESLGKEYLSQEIISGSRNNLLTELHLLENERTKKEDEKREEEKRLYETDRLIELAKQTSKLGSKANAEASVTATSKALLMLDLIEQASIRTIEWERQSKLEPVYEDIANVWNKMKGEKDSRIEIDDTTTPILLKQGRRFELSQLSGGEKTALLVIIRTVLCRKFAPIGFMLLDEPLEHLDPENRRMVIDFLVESFEKGWLDQLIVTTFEESLLRKYHAYSKVNILAL